MPPAQWTLTDQARDIYVENLRLGERELGVGLQLRKRRLRGGPADGIDAVELASGPLRVVVLPTRGMGIWKAWWNDVEIGWQAPIRGPVHPALVPVEATNGIGWLAGFDELLCRCGLESNGAPQFAADGKLQYPLHGRVANTPAHRVAAAYDKDGGELSVSGVVDETRMFGVKLRLEATIAVRGGGRSIEIRDRVSSLSAQPAGFQMLYHVNFGHPLLSSAARIVAPVRTLAPRDPHSASDVATWDTYRAPQTALQEFAHYAELAAESDGRTRALLETTPGQFGVSVAYNVRQLPTFTIWKNPLKPEDGYVTGLEPGVNFPNIRAFEQEQGRVVELKPGESREFALAIEIHPDAASVGAAHDDIARLAHGAERKILNKPRVDWSPAT